MTKTDFLEPPFRQIGVSLTDTWRGGVEFGLVLELTHALFRGQIGVPAVQSPAEELVKRLDWAL